MSNLSLVKTENFGNLACDFYKNDLKDILMTREQIGLALEYNNPMIAIAKIHERHQDRFEKFSLTSLVNGRETYFYNSKGVYEICRWSRQPKADAFIDWAWEVIENLRISTDPQNLLSQEIALKFGRLISKTSKRNMPALLSIMEQSGIVIKDPQTIARELLENHFEWDMEERIPMRSTEIFRIIGSPTHISARNVAMALQDIGVKTRIHYGYVFWFMPTTTTLEVLTDENIQI